MTETERDNDLLEIYNHFGQEVQLEKLREEVGEFIDAVKSGDKEHSEEEAGDIMTVLFGILHGERLNIMNAMNTIGIKKARTIERIKSGYYEEQV